MERQKPGRGPPPGASRARGLTLPDPLLRV